MFEKMKSDLYKEGYEDGKRNGEVFATVRQCPDTNGITYATQGDYMKAKVAFNAKDTEIAGLKNRVKDLEKQIVDSSKTSGNHKDELAKYRKELERFYLEAIGNAKTVKQVKAVMDRYAKSSLCFDQTALCLRDITCVHLFAKTPQKFNVPSIQQAATTKIKRINTKDAHQLCTMLDTTTDRTLYASSMATTLKGIANIEVDMTYVLAAKDSGLDAWNVLLSMLVAYGVKADTVLEVK